MAHGISPSPSSGPTPGSFRPTIRQSADEEEIRSALDNKSSAKQGRLGDELYHVYRAFQTKVVVLNDIAQSVGNVQLLNKPFRSSESFISIQPRSFFLCSGYCTGAVVNIESAHTEAAIFWGMGNQVAKARPMICPSALNKAVPAYNFLPSIPTGQAAMIHSSPQWRGFSMRPISRPKKPGFVSVSSQRAKAPGQSRAVQINSGRT